MELVIYKDNQKYTIWTSNLLGTILVYVGLIKTEEINDYTDKKENYTVTNARSIHLLSVYTYLHMYLFIHISRNE